MPIYEITKFSGGLSDFEDRGIPGAFKFGSGLDIRKVKDTLTCQQALKDIGTVLQSISSSPSPSASSSPSASTSPSVSPSISPSASFSPSIGSHSASISPSASRSPSASNSPSASVSPSHSNSPSPSPSAGLKTIFSDLIRFWVKCSDGNTYGFGNTGKIYKIDQYFNCSQVYDLHDQIKGACEKPSSSGKTYLVFSTNTNLHIKEIPGRSDWNDVDGVNGYPKTNLTGADWHTMCQIDGDVLIANGSTLAMAAYDDSYTNEALDLIPGNIAKTLVERDGRVVIGSVKASDPTSGINAAIDAEYPLAQIGTDGDVYYANMVDSIPVKRFPGGGIVNPGGVCNEVDQANFFDWESNALSWIDKQSVGNMALWGVYNATSGYNGIYSLGRKNKNHPFVMNLEYAMDVDEIGALAHVNGITIASYRHATSFGVMIVDTNNKATGIYEGLDFKAPVKQTVLISQWKTAEVFCAPLPSGASIEFWYKVNKTGSFIRAYTTDGKSSYSVANGKKASFSIGVDGEIFEPRLVLNPIGNTSPEVHRIRVFFS